MLATRLSITFGISNPLRGAVTGKASDRQGYPERGTARASLHACRLRHRVMSRNFGWGLVCRSLSAMVFHYSMMTQAAVPRLSFWCTAGAAITHSCFRSSKGSGETIAQDQLPCRDGRARDGQDVKAHGQAVRFKGPPPGKECEGKEQPPCGDSRTSPQSSLQEHHAGS